MLMEDLQALLDPLALGGAWCMFNPSEPLAKLPDAEAVAPYLIWQEIVAVDLVTLAGPSDLQNARVQVDCYAPRYIDADRLCRLVDATLVGGLTAIPLSRTPVYEAAVGLYRIIREYSVWHSVAGQGDDLKTFQSTLYVANVGRIFNGAPWQSWAHEMTATAGDGGAISAVGLVEGTNDPRGLTGWTTICNFTATGTGSVTDQPVPPVAFHDWRLVRHRLTSITGATGSYVQFDSVGS